MLEPAILVLQPPIFASRGADFRLSYLRALKSTTHELPVMKSIGRRTAGLLFAFSPYPGLGVLL
ncbi:MAG: hypothetical protein NVV73_22470 [Cellvibrionaceae bacterium]|nr:hypothetical protein [Cellvibrionaceae bacterium]